MILSVKNLKKQYKDKKLLDGVSFSINEGDKIAIVGVNGSGKSTLIKILLEIDYPDNKTSDKYEIQKNPNIKIGYISQNMTIENNISAFEYIKKETKEEVEDYEIKSVLNKLKLDNYDDAISSLSGGQKRKVFLGIALLKKTDLLILDEPTNHLDEESIEWLESYLNKYKGAIIMVSHDRYFINKVVDSIFELENGNLHEYKDVNFEEYLDLKAQRIEDEKAKLRKNKTLYRKEFSWISRGVRARGTKSKERIARFEKLKGKIKEDVHSPLDLTSVASRIGTKTIELESISKSFANDLLFGDFSYNFGRYERVGIVGSNGAGKTTLLNMIAGKEEISSGKMEIGETVRMGYFSQTFEEVNEDLIIIDFIKSKAEYIETVYGNISAENLLENFLFPRNLIHQKISTLSGGEKKRLFLVSLVMDSPNVLILDEPTNDFDVDTLLVLEEYIENFQGIVIVVSHDRYFLSKIVDNIFYVDKDEKEIEVLPNYDSYLEYLKNKKKEKNLKNKEVVKKVKPQSNQKIKFTFNEQKEFETIDDDIEEIEVKLREIDKEVVNSCQDYNKLNELLDERKELEEKLDNLQERWIYLNEKYELINQQKNS